MKFTFFCLIPNFERSVECDSFESAFRQLNAHVDLVIDHVTDFNLIDTAIGIEENGHKMFTNDANVRAIRTGLMDQIHSEKDLNTIFQDAANELANDRAYYDDLVSNAPAPVARDLASVGMIV